MKRFTLFVCLLTVAFAACSDATDETTLANVDAAALDTDPIASTSDDSAAVVDVIERYHAALAAGDSVAALALLDPEVVVLESGGMETRAEYEAHHLAADMEFSRSVPSVRGPAKVVIAGDVAWVSSTSTAQGTFRDRPVNSAGAELMVLRRDGAEWKIAAIHWSSRNLS